MGGPTRQLRSPHSEGRIPTTAPALAALVRELSQEDEVLASQEVGTFASLRWTRRGGRRWRHRGSARAPW